jgi:dihydroxyacetone kinase phosphotransfer subunit
VIGLVVVSHSAQLAASLSKLAGEMGGGGLRVVPAGGGADGAFGVDAAGVAAAIAEGDSGDGVVILCDLGSAVLSTRTAIELRPDHDARLVDAPLVEGAIAAAVMASTGASLDEVARAAEGARGASKL